MPHAPALAHKRRSKKVISIAVGVIVGVAVLGGLGVAGVFVARGAITELATTPANPASPAVAAVGYMSPTIEAGDTFDVDANAYKKSPPKTGDIVQYGGPEGQLGIRRVIAGPGQTCELKEGVFYVDGKRLVEPYTSGASTVSREKVTLDSKTVLICGDNRDFLAEQLSWGTMPIARVLGMVINIKQNQPRAVHPTPDSPSGSSAPSGGSVSFDPADAVGTWHASGDTARIDGFIISDRQGRDSYFAGDLGYSADIEVSEDGEIVIRIENPKPKTLTGQITVLTAKEMVIAGVGNFTRGK